MPVTSPDKPDELTMTQAAAQANVSEQTLRRAMRKGELREARRIGNSILLDRAAVEAWARRREEEQKR